MKLKSLIPFLDFFGDAIIYQIDMPTDENGDYREVFRGCICDIPWHLLNYYLDIDPSVVDSNAVYVSMAENENGESYPHFNIYIKERLK